MNRMIVLWCALLGLALFVGCNQSDGSGSEWLCWEARVGVPYEQEWKCYSQEGWADCKFKYICSDVIQEEWFCSRSGGRKYDQTCADQYICQDLAGHNWACDSEEAQAICETNYFADPLDFFLCNSAARNRDPELYWACPDLGGNLPSPSTNFRQITVRTYVPDPNPPPEFRIVRETVDAPCNLDPEAEGCTFLGGEECAPLWSMDGRSDVNATFPGDPPAPPPDDKGAPKDYCNPVACTRI